MGLAEVEEKKSEIARFFSLKAPVDEPKKEKGPRSKIDKMRLAAGGRVYFPQINFSELNVSFYDKTQMFYSSVKPGIRQASMSYFCRLDDEGRRNVVGVTLTKGQMID